MTSRPHPPESLPVGGARRACGKPVPLTEVDTVALYLDGWRICPGVARLPTLTDPDQPTTTASDRRPPYPIDESELTAHVDR